MFLLICAILGGLAGWFYYVHNLKDPAKKKRMIIGTWIGIFLTSGIISLMLFTMMQASTGG